MSLHDDLSRREFLSIAGAGAAALATESPCLYALARSDDLWELSAVDAVNAMKRGDVTAERYASALLAPRFG